MEQYSLKAIEIGMLVGLSYNVYDIISNLYKQSNENAIIVGVASAAAIGLVYISKGITRKILREDPTIHGLRSVVEFIRHHGNTHREMGGTIEELIKIWAEERKKEASQHQ